MSDQPARLMHTGLAQEDADYEVDHGTLAYVQELAQDHIRMVRAASGIDAAAREVADLYVLDASGAFIDISAATDLSAPLVTLAWCGADAELGAQLAAIRAENCMTSHQPGTCCQECGQYLPADDSDALV